MGIVVLIVFGLIVGVAAKWVMPGKDPGGLIITILLGIGGSMLGGYLASLMGLGAFGSFSVPGFLISIGGAVLLLIGYRALKK